MGAGNPGRGIAPSMRDVQEQLACLGRRTAKIDRKFAKPRVAEPPAPNPEPLHDYPFEEVATAHGRHFETEKLYERHRRHGSIGITDLEHLAHDLLDPISNGQIRGVPPAKWCFLDTETTGLAGGSGTYAFLLGIRRITPQGVPVRQVFMREFGEEAPQPGTVSDPLKPSHLVTPHNVPTSHHPPPQTPLP